MHWHIDHLRQHAEFVAGIPIRTSEDVECELAAAIREIADRQAPGFGSTDCDCPSHLFGMDDDPFRSKAFSDVLLYFRMGKLEEELERTGGGRGGG
jgi:sugar fermentation stimulation protein A